MRWHVFHRLAIQCVVALCGAGLLAGLIGCGGKGTTKVKDTLIVLEEDSPGGLDYDGPSVDQQSTETVINNTMEPLLTYPSRASGDVLVPDYTAGADKLEPRLATSWTQDGLKWTLKLREGVKSCAGNEFTADDVIYTIARAKSVSGAAPIGWFMNNVAAILPLAPVLPDAKPADKELKGEVEKVDEYTVRFTQENANDLFPRNLTLVGLLIFDSTEVKKHATPDDPWSHNWVNTKNSPGFGPYCLVSWNKGSETRLDANPSYYRGEPQFKHIITRKVESSSNRIASVGSGAADIVTNLTPKEYRDVSKNSNVSVLGWQNNKVVGLGLSYNFEPWKGSKGRLLRQAVAHALPTTEIIRDDYLDEAKPWYGACPSTSYGYAPVEKYGTDIDKAKSLMAQAGYPGGEGLHADGLTLYYPAERRALLGPMATRVRTALAQIGMNVQLAPISTTEYADRKKTKYDMPMVLEDQDRPLMPDVGFCALLYYVSKANGGANADFAYDNPKFDALYKKSAGSVGQERLAALKEMQSILMTDLPFVPIAEPKSEIAVRKGLTGWQGTAYDTLSYFEFKSK